MKTLKPVIKLAPDLAGRLRDFADMIDKNELRGIAIVVDTGKVFRFVYDNNGAKEALALATMLQHHLLRKIFEDGGE